MTTTETTAAQLIQQMETHRNGLRERRAILVEELAGVDQELSLLDGVKLPKKARSDKGTKRKRANGAALVDSQDSEQERPR